MENNITVSDEELEKICKWIWNIAKLEKEKKIDYKTANSMLNIIITYSENIQEILFNKKHNG
jgi:hypothetical protein